ncbi:MAG: endonuclease/exonuclease/phosphatase family protein [Phycisphaerales bacterium]|nr:endonuclease/exonuclease/phosphatase family protein [Phycisphaerales bacterium]
MRLRTPRSLVLAATLALPLTLVLGSCGPSTAPATPRGSAANNTTSGTGAPADSIYLGTRVAPPRHDGAIRIATYNLLNLFDDIDDPAYSGNEEDIDDAKPQSERTALGDAIARLDADVLALQEIESESALAEFRDQHLAGLGYDYLVSIDTGDPRGIECAVLSRFPLSNVQHWAGLALGGVHPDQWGNSENFYAGEPITFKRSPLRVDVTVPTPTSGGGGEGGSGGAAEPYILTLFVLHNKSGGPGGYWREAESRKIVELIAEARDANPEANIVVLGDLNATSDEQSVQTLLDAGLTELLPVDQDHWAATMSHESGRRIDHILVSGPAMAEVVPGSAFILGTPTRAPGSNWRTTPAPAGFASDHLPVAVELWIGDR